MEQPSQDVPSTSLAPSTLPEPSSGTALQEGVVHLKSFLSPRQQCDLYQDILCSTPHYSATRARNPKSNFLKIIAFDCRRQADLIPSTFSSFAQSACYAACQLSPSTIPPSYSPNYITAFRYEEGKGRLTGHCDKVEGWVVLFSLGCTAMFHIKGKEMHKKEVLEFESGDVLVFNGGTEWNVWHGIDAIVPGTCPSFLPDDLHNFRISLQLRQTGKNDNRPIKRRKQVSNS
ncbi:hypothetical protein QOT17_022108 [Balamuthia mandrillaris]